MPVLEVQMRNFPDEAPTAVPVLAPGISVSHTRIVDDFHCLYVHSNEFVLDEIAEALDVRMYEESKLCQRLFNGEKLS